MSASQLEALDKFVGLATEALSNIPPDEWEADVPFLITAMQEVSACATLVGTGSWSDTSPEQRRKLRELCAATVKAIEQAKI